MGLDMKQILWYGKRVLITGHTGFKGTWLSLYLSKRVKVYGVSLPRAWIAMIR